VQARARKPAAGDGVSGVVQPGAEQGKWLAAPGGWCRRARRKSYDVQELRRWSRASGAGVEQQRVQMRCWATGERHRRRARALTESGAGPGVGPVQACICGSE
jgi:hypothetical protein